MGNLAQDFVPARVEVDAREAAASEKNYAAEWVQSDLNLSRKNKKLPPIVLSPFARRAVQLLSRAFRTGIYNLQVRWDNADWQCGHGVRVTLYSGGLSTFDFDHLTRLVIAAHDECIRVDIEAAAPRYFRIFMHPRSRDGNMTARHPTIEEAAAAYRGIAPSSATWNEAKPNTGTPSKSGSHAPDMTGEDLTSPTRFEVEP